MNDFQWNSRSITNNLIMMNAVVFLAQFLSPKLDVQMTQYLGLHAIESIYFQPHQLITYMFLHGSLSHLFFNMFALWMFGRVLEYDLGSKRFLMYYMITGIGAGALNLLVNWWEMGAMTAQYALSDPAGLQQYINATVTIGASGAVFGILVGFGMMHPNDRLMLLIPPIPIKAKYFVIGYGALELLLGFTSNGNIAHFAHIGGMIFGFILLKYWKSKGKLYF